jgi:sulfur-carrier protein
MRILFFASLKEALKCSELTLEPSPNLKTVNDLIAQLSAQGEPWESALANNKVLVAINQEVSKREDIIKDSDEVAFFPPVTGG